jgi:hypothetical protein
MTRRPIRFAVLACLALAAAAASAGPTAARERPCREDVKKHCSDAGRGGGAVARCLREHEKELSPACRDSLAARREQAKERAGEVKDACGADISTHCAGVEQGEGGVARCLREHEADLSPECRAALPKPRAN